MIKFKLRVKENKFNSIIFSKVYQTRQEMEIDKAKFEHAKKYNRCIDCSAFNALIGTIEVFEV